MSSIDDLKGMEFGPKREVTDEVKTSKQETKPESNTMTYYVQKYSDKTMLAEAVLIDGLPFFLVADLDGSISIKETIEMADRVLKPVDSLSYVNKPYVFSSKKEVESLIEKSHNETLDSLYKEVKSLWKKYVDADDFHITICASDTIFTYFQDKLGLTHYLFFIGNNGSGKSNNLKIFNILGYRNMMTTDMTSANIYQYLGIMEEGVGTLCEDEADDIDEDRDKMRIYKNGYTTGQPVLRTDTTYGRKQFRFFTYCFKVFAAEKLPDSTKAKGFNQRIVEIACVYGLPQYDIAEITNPAGEIQHQELLDELLNMRNSLLLYRLKHFKDAIADIGVNLQNREKQLFKPLLRLFAKADVLKDILPVISKYVRQKREANSSTLYAFIYNTIKQLIEKNESLELNSADIWQTMTDPDELPGDVIPNRRLSYESVEFGIISQKRIVEILVQVFGAKQSRNRHRRSLLFDIQRFDKVGKIYDLDNNVEVSTNVTDVTHVTDIGLDKYVKRDELNEKVPIIDSRRDIGDIAKRLYYEKVISQNIIRNSLSAVDPSHQSYASSSKED